MLHRNMVYVILAALLTTPAAIFMLLAPIKAQSTSMEVVNPAVGNGNFIFFTNTTKVGDRFNATIWIKDASNLFAFQIYVTVNDTLLNITRAWIPQDDIRYVFFGQPIIPPPKPTPVDDDGDGSCEALLIGDSLLAPPGVSFTGKRLAAIVEFEILAEPSVQEPKIRDNLNINNSDTFLLDDSLSQIPAAIVSGYYEYNYILLLHDVLIADVASDKTVLGQEYASFIMVLVENQGNCLEDFNVTAYANTTVIETKTITDFPPEAIQSLSFTLDASNFVSGNYTIWACAGPVQDETNTENNNLTGGWIIISITGDITGPSTWPDGIVDMRDIAYVARRFMCGFGDPLWDSNADINDDDIINMVDIGIVARHFMEHYS